MQNLNFHYIFYELFCFIFVFQISRKISSTSSANDEVLGGENLTPPDLPAKDKEWHSLITMDLRNHMVGKIIKVFIPLPDPADLDEKTLKDQSSYARITEEKLFKLADDKEEYYHFLVKKVYELRKEFCEITNQKLSEKGNTTDLPPILQNELS